MDGAERVPRPRYTAKRKEFFLPKRGERLSEKRRTGYFSSLIATLGYNPALCKHKIYFHTNLTRTSYSAVRYQGGVVEHPFEVVSLEVVPSNTCAQKESRKERPGSSHGKFFTEESVCIFGIS